MARHLQAHSYHANEPVSKQRRYSRFKLHPFHWSNQTRGMTSTEVNRTSTTATPRFLLLFVWKRLETSGPTTGPPCTGGASKLKACCNFPPGRENAPNNNQVRLKFCLLVLALIVHLLLLPIVIQIFFQHS